MAEKRRTPLMGWASWNCFRTDINEEKIKAQADALVATGLAECGYTYLNIDDGYFGGRNEDGELLFHKERFPNGMKVLADYAHSLGLKAGIYSDAGDNTCGYYYDGETKAGFNVGLYGHEEQDLRKLLVENDFDFIKVDWCGGLRLNLDEEEQYTKIGKLIDKISEEVGKSIVYNICRWQFPGEWATTVADSWRTGLDIFPSFESVMYQLDEIKPLAKFCRPGHVNDLDMMQIGNGLSLEEEKTHFAMWCMLSTPLMIGCDMRQISPETLEVLKNKELIAINQDKACLQAVVVKEYRDEEDTLRGEVWVKDLGEKSSCQKAVALLNRSNSPLEMAVSLEEMGLSGKLISIRDVCSYEDLAPTGKIMATVPARGVIVYRVCGENGCAVVDINAGLTYDERGFEQITEEAAREIMKKGGMLVDVRTAAEFEREHLDGAVNISYADIYTDAHRLLPDKEQVLIVYCATGKRSGQAKMRLDSVGYKEVYYLGGIY